METDPAITVSKSTVKKVSAFLGIGLFIVAATMALHWRAASGDVPSTRLLPVTTLSVERQASYQANETYAGRIEARQQVNLAFEQPGKIEAVYVEEGEPVNKGDLIARQDTALLEASRDQTSAALKRIETQVELAKLTEARQRKLFEQGHSSGQQFDDARLNREALEAQRSETTAALRTIEINIEKSSLYAPFDAEVGARTADAGAVLNAGMTVVTLLEATSRQARVSLPASRVDAVMAAENLNLHYGETLLPATLAAIRTDVNPVTRTQDVLFSLTDETPLPFGSLVELALPETRHQQGYWIPVEALIEGKKGLWSVFAIEAGEEGNRVARRAVEIIHAETGRVFITANMGPEARLIANGTHRVVPGQYVDATIEVGE